MVMIIFVMLLWGLPLTLQLSRPSPPTDPSLHPDHTERINRCNKSINISTKSNIALCTRFNLLIVILSLSVRITAGSICSIPPIKSRISWRRLSLSGGRLGPPSPLKVLPSSTFCQVQVLPSPSLLLLPLSNWFTRHQHCIVVGHVTVSIDITVVVSVLLC